MKTDDIVLKQAVSLKMDFQSIETHITITRSHYTGVAHIYTSQKVIVSSML